MDVIFHLSLAVASYTAKIKWFVLTHIRLPQLQPQYQRIYAATCGAIRSLYLGSHAKSFSLVRLGTRYVLLIVLMNFSFLLKLEKQGGKLIYFVYVHIVL